LSKLPRFYKLPFLEYWLTRYSRVLYLDDDVILSPATPDLFSSVPCDSLGAVRERHKPSSWHAMLWKSACELYGGEGCDPKRRRRPKPSENAGMAAAAGSDMLGVTTETDLFNSGVMLLSRGAAVMLRGWRGERLECRVLCDQLFFNAMARRHRLRVHDLGVGFNYVTELTS
ncbi:MAG: hypothetical protein SGPRY_013930, partial [Prymnesium sp.]